MTDERVRVAVVGITGFGRSIARAVAKAGNLQLITGFSRTPEARSEFVTHYNCPKVFNSYEELLADPEIEAVLLVTPNHVHSEQIIQAAQARKHVFVDKPITNTVAEARPAIAACREAGVLLQVGHNTRKDAVVRHMKRAVAAGELGKVTMAESQSSGATGQNLTPQQWRFYRDKAPACPLMQLGIHWIDAVHSILGPTKRVWGRLAHLASPADIDDTILTILEMESGALCYIGSNYVVPHTRYLYLYGTQGCLLYDAYLGFFRVGLDNERKAIDLERNDTLLEEVTEFGRCVRSGKPPEVTGEVALLALAVVEAAVRSEAEARPIDIAEVLGTA
jgi:predicted dehydrogenase